MVQPVFCVEYQCHLCGQSHVVVEELGIIGGGAWTAEGVEGGSLDRLYPHGDLPDELERLLGELVWCDEAGDWIELEDPARVFLVPSPPTS
jgi:hypothetical protein